MKMNMTKEEGIHNMLGVLTLHNVQKEAQRLDLLVWSLIILALANHLGKMDHQVEEALEWVIHLVWDLLKMA